MQADVRRYFTVRDELSVHEGIIFRGQKVIVPSSLTIPVINHAHEGHQGIVKTKQRLRALYWFPGMDTQTTSMIKHCITCQLSDKSVSTKTAPMQSVPLPNKCWEKVGIDIVGPDYSATPDCRFAITLIDYHSKWPEVAFVNKVGTEEIIDFLKTVFSREGFPMELVSDNGVQFTSREFELFLSERNIVHRYSALYHPRGNSEVERFNRVLKQSVQTAKLDKQPIKKSIREFLAIYRSTPHCTTGEEPKILLHGRHLITKLDIVKVTRNPTKGNDQGIRNKVKRSQAKSKEYFDKRHGVQSQMFRAGDWVRVKKPGHVHKGSSSFYTPIRIDKQVAQNTYMTTDGRKWNVERLVPFRAIINPILNNDREEWNHGNVGPGQDDDGIHVEEQRPVRMRRQPRWLDDYQMGR